VVGAGRQGWPGVSALRQFSCMLAARHDVCVISVISVGHKCGFEAAHASAHRDMGRG